MLAIFMGYIKIHLKYSHGKFTKIIPFFKNAEILCATHSVSYNININQKTQLLYGVYIWKLEEFGIKGGTINLLRIKTLHFHCRGHGFDPWLGN